MANHKSALKRHRQSVKINERNSAAKTAVRTVMKKILAHTQNGEIDQARALLPLAEKRVAQAASKGLYHKNNAARKISRMYAAVNRAGVAGKSPVAK
jgi:small subunit ribosomal protein S20